jgi:tubby and related proteins
MMEQRIKEAEMIKEKNKKAKHEEKVLMSDELMQKNRASDVYQQQEPQQSQPQTTSSKQKAEMETKQAEKQKQEEASNNDDNPTNLKPLINIDIPDMKAFLTRPAPNNGIVQCSIKRDRSGFGRFFPKYHIYFSVGSLIKFFDIEDFYFQINSIGKKFFIMKKLLKMGL